MTDPTPEPTHDLDRHLRDALGAEARRAAPRRPSAGDIAERSRRQHRRTQRRSIAAGALAAAVVLVVVARLLTPSGDVTVEQGPVSDPPATAGASAPFSRLVLDQSFASIDDVLEVVPVGGVVPGTVPGAEGHSRYETLTFRQPGSLSPPWLRVTVRTTANPTGPWGEPLPGDQRVAVGDREGVLHTTASPHLLSFKYDERREISAKSWGLSDDEMIAAVAALREDGGEWHLDTPPAGMTRVSRAQSVDDVADWFQTRIAFQGRDGGPAAGAYFVLDATRSASGIDLDDLVVDAADQRVIVTPGGDSASVPSVSRTTVRGHPALVDEVAGYDGVAVTYRWIEPETRTTYRFTAEVDNRADAEQAVGNLVEVDEVTWRELLADCVSRTGAGTVPVPATTARRPRCDRPR